MAEQIKLPELSETVHTGVVARVLVAVGDRIEKGQAVVEIETDKAVVEVPSSLSGVVEEIHVKAGDEVSVGQPLVSVADSAPEAEPARDVPSAPASAEEPAPAPETAPSPETTPSPEPTPPPPVSPPASAERESTVHADGPRRLIPAAPSVRRFARELGVNIEEVTGTGPGGRISIDDVKAFVRERRPWQGPAMPAATLPPAAALPDFSRWGEIERVSMSGVRRATARNLAQAWTFVPHVTQYDKADITQLEELRRRYGPRAEAAGGKLTVTAIIVKVAASALKVFPKFNSSIDVANQQLIFKKYYHIGVAVDTEHGLLVPVIRDVDRKNLIELAVELTAVSERARQRKLSAEDMQGGSFTVSNLGGIGGTGFSPIVNWPEVAILGVARSRIEPVYRDGAFEPRRMLPLALSYDHRVIDGADAARFLRWICEALEDPFLLTVEG